MSSFWDEEIALSSDYEDDRGITAQEEPRTTSRTKAQPGEVLSSGEDMERLILNSSTADPPLEEREEEEDKDQFQAAEEELGAPRPETIANFVNNRFRTTE
ncbi:hypothetical protein RRG08_008221 [Elysia crispata]|uniref:Uncharacterized protein n=1 Tax=Elysia crispata TaxID=231223 RepID=A0AAE0YBM1_9GAST|nr:hypothetical protein RRG08_008221 [Elysia crispata]